MKLNRTPNPLDRLNRIGLNENWDILERKFNDLVGEITDEVFKEIIDSVRLNWKEPVDSFKDLPSGADVGDTRMVRDTGKVYHFDGESWIEIQDIDPTAINEVDNRLSKQLADTEQEVENIFRAIDETALGVDVQGIDTETLNERNEKLPVEIKDREVVVMTVVNEAIEDGTIRREYIDMDILRRFKSYDFLIINDSVNDIRISVTHSTSASSKASMNIVMEDGSFAIYGTGSSDVHHKIPAKTRGFLLSHVPATNSEGLKAMSKKPYEHLYSGSYLSIQYRQTESSNSQGNVGIILIGVPN